MSTKKFQDIFWFGPKSKIKAGDGLDKGRFPFYTSSPILKKYVDTEQYFDEALIFGTGGSASVHFADEPFSTSTDCIVAISNDKNFNTKFVYYYLHGNLHILERGFKGAGLKHISKKYIQNIAIPAFDIETQNKIVAILDKVGSLVQKRQQNIDLLDELLRAQFLEMFGDLGDPQNKWPKKKIIDICKNKNDTRCGPFGTQLAKSEFTESGVPLWGIKHINSEFSIPTDEFVSQEKAVQLSNYALLPRDIVMTRKGSIGNTHIYPNDIEPGIMHSDVVRIRVNEEIMNPYFLSYQFKFNNEVRWQINRVSPGVVMAGINVSKLKHVFIRVPELSIQNKFEKLHREIIALKSKLEKSEINDLKNSLLQRAFSGKLNLSVSIALDALLEEIDLKKTENDLFSIITNEEYLFSLINKLNNHEFENQDLYDKAKHAVFQLLKAEEELITQEYDEKTKSLKLVVK